MTWTNRASIALALKENLEADEGVDLKNADAVDASVTAATGDRHLLEARLSEQALQNLSNPAGGRANNLADSAAA